MTPCMPCKCATAAPIPQKPASRSRHGLRNQSSFLCTAQHGQRPLATGPPRGEGAPRTALRPVRDVRRLIPSGPTGIRTPNSCVQNRRVPINTISPYLIVLWRMKESNLLATDLQSAPITRIYTPGAVVGVEPRFRIMSPACYHCTTTAVAIRGIEPLPSPYERLRHACALPPC